ncbi:DVU_1556 family methyltransferase [uncultured Desulfovibrio sp.]|uniref:DVU_1556 family methyltransferase n=1 Tax=uncultured Desulfovibrio sp. TaxID=167968 RepID=UPI0026173E76|nr:class I SAM-dependent methyltransferase [uncultured Desulfovibrio sp.]
MEAPLYARPEFRRVAGDAWRPGGLAVTRRGLALCAFPAGARLLDMGCGAGATLRLLRALGYHAVGLDRHPDGAATPPCLCGTAVALPLRDGVLDGVICECVLSLLPDGLAALREAVRVLRPSGRLLLSDLFLAGPAPSFLPDGAPASCACGARSLPELRRLFRQAGLRLLHDEDHSPCLRALAARLLWNDGEGSVLPVPAGPGCSRTPRRYGYGLWILEKTP